jgi:hypothetical protein
MFKYSRRHRWFNIFCAGLIFAAGCAEQTNPNLEKPDLFAHFTQDLLNWPDRIIEDSKDPFLNTDNLIPLILAGGASIAMHNSDADKNFQENVENHQGIDGFPSETLNVIGGPGFHFAAAGLWYALSIDNNDQFNTERAWTMMTALAITGLTTVGLKAIRDNDNPNGDRFAWPSGHTSSSFAAAAVLDEFYGPKVGIPAYLLASLVGYRMIDEGDHWASDVVFGATLGWIVGHSVARKHKNLEVAGFQILPYTTVSRETTIGISFVKLF